jgi:hypothetical protein
MSDENPISLTSIGHVRLPSEPEELLDSEDSGSRTAGKKRASSERMPAKMKKGRPGTKEEEFDTCK